MDILWRDCGVFAVLLFRYSVVAVGVKLGSGRFFTIYLIPLEMPCVFSF